MTLISPLWLLALLPWTAVVVWLLTGRRERTAVPFLELWRGSDTPLPKARAAMHIPPPSILLVLFAALLAILAAARPRVSFLNSNDPPKAVILIDRGFSMGASWKGLLEEAEHQTFQRFRGGLIERVFIPATESAAIDTRQLVVAAVRRALDEPNSVVFVISDQVLGIDDPRLFQLAPATPARNVGFISASAAALPRPQVMVRVRNDSPLTGAELKVGGSSRTIELPPAGQEKNYFIDVEPFDKTTRLELVMDDDQPADNRAELIRTSTWPRLELTGDLSPELLRMIDVYRKLRPPQRDSTAIAVTTNPAISAGRPAVVIAAADRPAGAAGIQFDDHPISSVVDWQAIAKEDLRIAPSLPSDWKFVANAGENPILAVRENPSRQVWVGFASDSFARDSDFVIFWTNVFDWVGQDDERFAAAGTFALPIPTPPANHWHSKLALPPPVLQSGVEISPLLTATAAFLIFAAALLWGVAKTAR